MAGHAASGGQQQACDTFGCAVLTCRLKTPHPSRGPGEESVPGECKETSPSPGSSQHPEQNTSLETREFREPAWTICGLEVRPSTWPPAISASILFPDAIEKDIPWVKHATPIPKRPKQENSEFKASLCYRVRSCLNTCSCAHTHMITHTYTHTQYTHTYTHTCIHYTHKHTHTYILSLSHKHTLKSWGKHLKRKQK